MVIVGNFHTRAELRKKPRRQFHYSARIVVDPNRPPLSCTISDVSHSGARIALDHDEGLPERFVLLLAKKGGARRLCRVVWRTEQTCGVAFIGAPA